MKESIKREFSPRNFGFGGVQPEDFCRFQWKWPGQPASFIVYRIAIATYQLLWNILVIVYWDDTRFYQPIDNKAKWPIYISNWSFLLLTIYFITAAVSTVYYYYLKKKHHKVTTTASESVRMELVDAPPSPQTHDAVAMTVDIITKPNPSLPWYFKVTWLLQAIASTAVVFVAMGYWCFEFDPEYEKIQVFTFHVHAVAAILAIADFSLVSNPCRYLHFVYASIYFAVYVIFSVVYYHCGGYNPYGGREMYEGMIDWEDGVGVSVFMGFLFVFVLAPVIHGLYYGLYLLRRLGAGEISAPCTRRCCFKSGNAEHDIGNGKPRTEEFRKLSEGTDGKCQNDC